MSRRQTLDEDTAVRSGLMLLGVMLLASAVLAFDAAREHMATISTLCGAAEHPHCGWCYAAAGFAVTGLAALVVAVKPAASKAAA